MKTSEEMLSEIEEKEIQLRSYEEALAELNKSLNQAKQDLGDISISDIEKLYYAHKITKQTASDMMKAAETLDYSKETCPDMIKNTENSRNEIIQELNQLKNACDNNADFDKNESNNNEYNSFCRHCGTKLPKDSLFCPQCGKALTMPKKQTRLKENRKFDKILATLYTIYLIIQCVFCVPHIVYSVQDSSQNVPHYVKVDEVIDVLWYKPLASVRTNGLPRYISTINYPILIMDIILVTIVFLLIYFCFRKTKNKDIGIK